MLLHTVCAKANMWVKPVRISLFTIFAKLNLLFLVNMECSTLHLKYVKNILLGKLDGVGPVDNKPSTN